MLQKFFKAIQWRYREFLFNKNLLTFSSLIKFYIGISTKRKFIKVEVKDVNKTFLVRTQNRIDRNVLEYVFLKKYHLPPKEFYLTPDCVIVDLGSNIGATLIDFNIRYPEAKIYGYEMHPENYKIAKENCKSYSSVFVNNKAVWTSKGNISFSGENLTDAFAIGKNNTLGKAGIEIPSITINNIIFENQLDNIDFLKMDIEGAEVEIFNADLGWLDCTSSMNIEFHNISDNQLDDYMQMLRLHGFTAYKSPHHWLSILAYRQ